MGLKRQGLHQHGGAVGSPAAHCPPTSLEMGTEAGLPRQQQTHADFFPRVTPQSCSQLKALQAAFLQCSWASLYYLLPTT